MTHDELLAKLELKRWHFVEYEDYLDYRRALRAVVELTKPKETYGTAFYDGYNEAMSIIFQAIEKELK